MPKRKTRKTKKMNPYIKFMKANKGLGKSVKQLVREYRAGK